MRTSKRPPERLEANDVTEFLKHVQQIRVRKGWFKKNDPWEPWFRGQQRAAWPLKPKLYRNRTFAQVKAQNVEDEIREEFIKRAPIMCETLPVGSESLVKWQWYFMMQHFGAATRLVDWTEGALIGLYFAVRNSPGEYDAAVWVLDPYQLNEYVIGKPWVIAPGATGVVKKHSAMVAPWLPESFIKMRGLPSQPVAVNPTHVAQRISSQHSCFTIHGKDEMALESLRGELNRCVVKIVIPRSGAQTIKKELRTCGITETTIFPELDGLGRSINAMWEIG